MNRLTLSAALNDAAALWRGERDLLLRVAGVFFFLPALAFGLVAVEPPVNPDASIEQAQAAMLQVLQVNLPYMAASYLVQEFGALVVLLMLLGPPRTRLSAVLTRALRLFPGFLLLSVLTSLAVFGGALLLVVPGLYLQGRTLLNAPAYAAAPARGPIDAFARGVTAARGAGFRLLLLWAAPVAASLLANAVWQGVGDPLIAASNASPPVRFLVLAGIAAIGTAGSIALTLLRASAYRLLGGARQGM